LLQFAATKYRTTPFTSNEITALAQPLSRACSTIGLVHPTADVSSTVVADRWAPKDSLGPLLDDEPPSAIQPRLSRYLPLAEVLVPKFGRLRRGSQVRWAPAAIAQDQGAVRSR
jgi:hypothetical protein